MALKYRKGSTAFAQTQSDAPRMMNDAGSNADDFLHHCFEAPPLGRMPHRTIWTNQRGLANGAQDVVRDCRQTHHQIVCRKFARRQSLQIQIGLELRMKLFTRVRQLNA